MSEKYKNIPKPPAKDRSGERFEKGEKPNLNESRLPTSELNPPKPKPRPKDLEKE